jgi:hypothetical protein
VFLTHKDEKSEDEDLLDMTDMSRVEELQDEPSETEGSVIYFTICYSTK